MMNKKQLLWDLFVHTGKIEYYLEYKKWENDNEKKDGNRQEL